MSGSNFEPAPTALLTHKLEAEQVPLFASHVVIGEACVALQLHYAVGKPDARAALRSVLPEVW